MKRFFALILSVVYLLSANVCLALNELYYLRDADADSVAGDVEMLLQEKNYTVQKKNPFYAISNKNSENYAVVVLQQNGQNLFYYIEANNKGTKFNKAFLKKIEERNIVYSQYYGETYMNYFADIAQKTITGEKKVYSFDSPKQPEFQKEQAQKTTVSNPNVLQGYVKMVGRGSVLDVYLQNAINTATANVGDNVVGVLKSDWVVNSQVIAPQGSVLYGVLIKAVHARAGMRNGGVEISFNKLVTPDGRMYDLVTQKVDFDVTNDGKLKSTASRVAVASAVGALAGLAFALLGGGGGDARYGTGAAIGAGVAGGLALVSSVTEKGVDAEIPSFTELEVVVDEDISVIFNY